MLDVSTILHRRNAMDGVAMGFEPNAMPHTVLEG
jgi:hypothetical protein